jgi:hypothetical protein
MANLAARSGPISIGDSATTVHTTNTDEQFIVRNMHIANVTGTAATLKLSIGADAIGTRLLGDVSIPANGTYDWSGFLVLESTETLQATGGTDDALTITVSGVEVS